MSIPLRERIEAKIERLGDHLIWTGSCIRGGCQVFVERGVKPASVQRVLWEERHGPTPGRIQRQCDKERCVNPDHFALKRTQSLSPERVLDEAVFIAHWKPRAEAAANKFYRTTGCSTAGILLDDVKAEAQLQLLIAVRTNDRLRDIGEDPAYVTWLIRNRLRDWLGDQTHSNKGWAIYHTFDDKPIYSMRDVRFMRPELAALDAVFIEAFQDALRSLTASEIDYLSVGVERSGEKIHDAAERLGVNYQIVRRNRRSVEMKLLGLLQARGWFDGGLTLQGLDSHGAPMEDTA